MCENFWNLGSCNKLNRRGMNCSHVGCGRTLDWVLIPGTPLFSMQMWKHITKFLAVFGESKCAAVSAQHYMGEDALSSSNFTFFSI